MMQVYLDLIFSSEMGRRYIWRTVAYPELFPSPTSLSAWHFLGSIVIARQEENEIRWLSELNN